MSRIPLMSHVHVSEPELSGADNFRLELQSNFRLVAYFMVKKQLIFIQFSWSFLVVFFSALMGLMAKANLNIDCCSRCPSRIRLQDLKDLQNHSNLKRQLNLSIWAPDCHVKVFSNRTSISRRYSNRKFDFFYSAVSLSPRIQEFALRWPV